MPSYTFYCEDCNTVTDATYVYTERPETIPCTACEGTAKYQISAPMVLRASYRDGVKRAGWKDLREASKLNKEAAVAKDGNRKQIEKEIGKLGYKFKKEGM